MNNNILTFSGVAASMIMMPGADLAVVLRNALTGRRAGLVTGIGVVGGLALHTLLAAVGLAAALAASDWLFLAVKTIGVVYLLHLGGKTLLSCLRAGSADTAGHDGARRGDATGGPAPSARKAQPRDTPSQMRFLLQGFITNAANPKAPILFLSLMPQFIPKGAPFVPMTLLLSGIIIIMGLLWFPFVATLASSVSGILSSVRVQRLTNGVIGAILVGLAIVLLLESAP
ncbi:LysE family translocator [Streptomyces sp. 8N706]|uniref:LysE family translocator n=1 Tax=Streptomyces sp. 8N706 TaxID=3457416 RepID=UPI003FD1C67B